MATVLVAVGEQVCANCGEPIPFSKKDKLFGVKKCAECGHKHIIMARVLAPVVWEEGEGDSHPDP